MIIEQWRELLLVFLIVLAAAIGMMAAGWWVQDRHVFRYDSRNPFRRYCKRCGQQQDQHSRSWDETISWWEDISPVPDPACRCHHHQEYRR